MKLRSQRVTEPTKRKRGIRPTDAELTWVNREFPGRSIEQQDDLISLKRGLQDKLGTSRSKRRNDDEDF